MQRLLRCFRSPADSHTGSGSGSSHPRLRELTRALRKARAYKEPEWKLGARRFLLVAFLIGLGGWSLSARSPILAAPQTPTAGHSSPRQHDTNGTPPDRRVLSKDARLAFIRQAQVWKPTDIPQMDLRAGPAGPGAFQPNEHVTCTYAEVPRHGATRKFHCTLPSGEVVKVRYGTHNGEVQASVVSTRLLWALGFQADRVYPVRVTCRGCSSDPWIHRGGRHETHDFDPAVIERKPPGHVMRDTNDKPSGWSWSELDLVDASIGGAPAEQRDALKLLAAFIQHTDSKRQQQRLVCASGDSDNGGCTEPFLMVHDVGMTFGRANTFNGDATGSVNFEAWSRTPIWKNPAACVAELSKSHTGTLGDPRIAEVGRQFLANLLEQLSDRQIRDLFEVAGVERRADSSGRMSGVPVDEWVAAFKSKRDEIVRNHCGTSSTHVGPALDLIVH